jgi:hypothetical protein
MKSNHTRELFIKILEKLNCPYTTGEENDRYDICFKYRGETFYADAMNESKWIEIFDPFWYEIDLNDSKGLAMLKEAINMANIELSINTIYEVNRKENKVYVHSKTDFSINNQQPDIENFVRMTLNSFTLAHRGIIFSLSDMKNGKRPYQKRRRKLSELTSTMKRNPHNYWNDDFYDMSEQDLLNIINNPTSYDADYLEEIHHILYTKYSHD